VQKASFAGGGSKKQRQNLMSRYEDQAMVETLSILHICLRVSYNGIIDCRHMNSVNIEYFTN
jgi:hypothetical protein